jgi:hypothetical protein
MEDDIAGLLNLTQAAAKMRPSKRAASLPPPRAIKLPPPSKTKPVKEVKPKAKPMPPPKTKLLKPIKPVKGAKVKGTSTRRFGEIGGKSSEKEKHSHRDGIHGSGGALGSSAMDVDGDELQMDKEEFRYLLESAVRESEIQMGKEVRKYKAGSAEVYGEALPDFVDLIRETLRVNSSDVFYDIGSGIGNVVCQMAAQVGCKCYGVELRPDLHNISERIYEYIKKETTRRGIHMGEVQLTNADALTQPTLLVDSTIVYLNNVCFPESMQQPLEHFFTETLQHGTRVVTIKELFPRMRPTTERFARSFATLFKFPCDKYEAPEGSVSWMHKGVPFYIYTVDREAWASVSLAINRPIGHSSDRTALRSSLASSSNSVKTELASPPSTTPKSSAKAKKASSPASPAAVTVSTSGSYTNPHAYFCLQPVDIYPSAIHTFSETLHDTQVGSPVVTVSSNDTSYTTTASDSSISEVTIALDTYKGLQSRRFYPTPSYVDITVVDEEESIDIEGEERRRDFLQGSGAELHDLFDMSESNSETSLVSVDRRLRLEIRTEREERANKISEITTLSVDAQRLDREWQESWLKTESLRAQLAQLEEDLATLSKNRHSAINNLTTLMEDETDETLKSIEEGAATKIQDFLESSKKFIDDNGIEVTQTKRGGRHKVDRRFGPRPKKVGVKQSTDKVEDESEEPIVAVAATASIGPDSNAMEEEEDDVASEAGSRSSTRLVKSNGSKNSNSMDVDEPEGRVRRSQVAKKAALLEELQERSETLAAAALAMQGSDLSRTVVSDFVRAPRPKRIVTMISAPPAEPSKKMKQVKPGQKSLDRRQLRKSLMEALVASPDGKLSIVELRQACKDLPHFKDLKEKQIERKVWDALSKAHDQFKHALPTPAERKAHAMGAGKAGLWSLHPKWKNVPTPSVSSQDSAEASDNDNDVDIDEIGDDADSYPSDFEEATLSNGPASSLHAFASSSSMLGNSSSPSSAALLASIASSSPLTPSLSSLVSTATNDLLLESIGNGSLHRSGSGLVNGSPTIKLRISSSVRYNSDSTNTSVPRMDDLSAHTNPSTMDVSAPKEEIPAPTTTEPTLPNSETEPEPEPDAENKSIVQETGQVVEEAMPESFEDQVSSEHMEEYITQEESASRKRPRSLEISLVETDTAIVTSADVKTDTHADTIATEAPPEKQPITEVRGTSLQHLPSQTSSASLGSLDPTQESHSETTEDEHPPPSKRPLTQETMNSINSDETAHQLQITEPASLSENPSPDDNKPQF